MALFQLYFVRLLLHANNASDAGFSNIVISSSDTDVLVLCLYFQKYINASLFQKSGTRNRTTLIDITKIKSSVGDEICESLIGLHAFTGCDSVSAFAGKGKITALKKLKYIESKKAFSKLGSEWTLSNEIIKGLEQFTCALYSSNLSTEGLNELRYHLFCLNQGEIEGHQLPPCFDAFKKHGMRANYQAAVWKRSLQNHPNTPTPVGNGWKIIETENNRTLAIDWMDGLPAPHALLDLLSCQCRKSCKIPKCVCLVNGFKCTEMCTLHNCTNQVNQDDYFEARHQDFDNVEQDVTFTINTD